MSAATAADDKPRAPSYRADIDGLRGVAVILVVAFHAFPAYLRGGFVGVDVFFVISGFLITGIIRNASAGQGFSLVDFYIRRARRLFPALAVVLLSTLAAGWLLLLADEFAQVGKHVASSAAFVINLVLWSESGYFDTAAETKPLLHLWSLGVEEQFYLIWPLALLVLLRTRRPAPGVAALALVSLVACTISTRVDPTQAFFSPLTRAWELLAGAMLALMGAASRGDAAHAATLMRARVLPGLANLASWTGLIAILVAAVVLHQGVGFPGMWAVLPVMGAALSISAGPLANANRLVLASPVFVYMGKVSYPFYLWHWPLLVFAQILLGQTPPPGVRAALVVASLALADITYRYVERPVRFTDIGPRRLIAICCALALAAVAGFAVYAAGGYPSRAANAVSPSIDPTIRRHAVVAAASARHVEQVYADRQHAIRAPYCHMNREGETFESYRRGLSTCLRMALSRPNVLVLGDSHAADLYVALNHSMGDRVNFLQATGAGCAPDHSMDHPGTHCARLHRHAIAYARSNGVDAVIVGGRWKTIQYPALERLLVELRSFTRVHVSSPPASFTADVNKLVARGPVTRTQSSISRQHIDREVLAQADRLRDLARKLGIGYVDRIAVQCEAGVDCALLSDAGELMVLDYGHLSRAGAYDLGLKLQAARVNPTDDRARPSTDER